MPEQKIVVQIEEYFVKQGWLPMLPIKTNALHALSEDELRALMQRIKAATDRFTAVAEVLAAIKDHEDKN